MTSVLNYLPSHLSKNSTLLLSTGATVLSVPPLLYLSSGWLLSRWRHQKLFRDEQALNQDGRLENYDYDLIIVGAGVIGCSIAAAIAQKEPNKRILIVERDMSQPDRIIGELLQPGGLDILKQLNLDHCVENIDASCVHGYGVFFKGKTVKLPYPKDEQTDQRPQGRGIHYGRFISRLRENAASYPNITIVEGTVRKLTERNSTVIGIECARSNSKQIEQFTAPLTIVANGAGSSFTKQLTGTKPLSRSTFVGVRIRGGNSVLPYPYHGNVFIVDPGPVLAYPTSSKDARVLVDFPNGTMPPREKLADYLKSSIAPQLPNGPLQEAFIEAVEEGDIRSVPNREMPSERVRRKGCLALGDALTMRHPLTGSGMTAGLTDVLHLTRNLDGIDYKSHEQVEQAVNRWWKSRNSSIATINVLANALYAVFTPAITPDPYVSLLQDACFSYFQAGGVCVSGPVGLLGALVKNPYVLISHYFAVALFTVKESCKPIPTPWSFYACYRAIKCAVGIVFPLLAEERILRPIVPSGLWNRDAERYYGRLMSSS